MIGGVSAAGGAALRAAACAGDTAACAHLLGNARSVRFSRDELGRSALHLAASAGHGAVVRLLLGVAAPREVDSPDGAGCTALQRAAADGHEEVVRLLLARGGDVDKQDSVHGNSALHEAAWKGYSRTVAILTSAGADLLKSNAGGFTALHLCCQNGHNQSCRELLLGGCDPDIQNNYGDTALHTAARYGHAGVTRILISAQCRVSEQNKNGDTALHIAAAMGRRKLTRILLEAGCDISVRNKQNETARDIALRKDLNEILGILDDCVAKKDKKAKNKKRSKSKVRFDSKNKDNPAEPEKTKHWSPYGCHYYPDPEAFPSPRLDSLPPEPLKRGEQYYLDLAGNIRKGPVGVGYTCYCAPLFRHLEARIERDKRELQKAQLRLGQRVAGLEQKINRGAHGRRSERVNTNRDAQQPTLPRSRSLEMLDCNEKTKIHAARSMDELENQDKKEQSAEPRRTVKELVARIQEQQTEARANVNEDNSESSDDEDSPLRMTQHHGPMGESNLATLPPSYENVPIDVPRSRSGMYSPTIINTALVDSNMRYIEPVVRVQESNMRFNEQLQKQDVPYATCQVASSNPRHSVSNPRCEVSNPRHSVPNTHCDGTDVRYDSSVPRYEPSNIGLVNSGPRCNAQRFGDQNSRFFDVRQAAGVKYFEQPVRYADSNPKYSDVSARFAKLRMLDSTKLFESSKSPLEGSSRMLDSSKMFESTTRMLENPQDCADRDTNNDSGYSTKVYGSSKGNSPSLSGQIDGDCLGASSLV